MEISNRFAPPCASFNVEDVLKKSFHKALVVAEKCFFALTIPLNPVTSFITGRLADFFVLEQIAHGTSLPNYLNIRVHGFDPRYGGTSNGSSAGLAIQGRTKKSATCCTNSAGFVHGFKDDVTDFKSLLERIQYFFATRAHARLSGLSLGNQVKGPFNRPARTIGAITGLFTPTINSMYRPEEIESTFEIDPDYYGYALRTRQKINPERIGFRGVIEQGLQGNLLKRIKKNRFKFVIGLIGLLNPLGIIALSCVGGALLVQSIRKII